MSPPAPVTQTERLSFCGGRAILSGLRHKYDDVRCAQFDLWRGARWVHPRRGAVTDEQRSLRPNSAQPGGRQVFFAQTSLLAPHRSTAGYARRSRLVWAKNPLPRTSSYLCLRPLSTGFLTGRIPALRACLKNSGAGLRPAMNGRLALENTGARRPKGRRDACPTTFFKHVLRRETI